MSYHANTPSPKEAYDDDAQKTTEQPQPALIKADDGIDGSLWHSVARVEEGVIDTIVCECGLRVRWTDADLIIFHGDDRPAISGSEICYLCTRSWSMEGDL